LVKLLTITASGKDVLDFRVASLYFHPVILNHTKSIAMKKSFSIFLSVFTVAVLCMSSVRAGVNEKVLQSFHRVFSEASNVAWSEYADHFQASFKQNETIIKVSYDKDGNMLSSIRYYKEQNLPLNVLYKLKKKYGDKKIDIVTEVSNADGVAYFIQLEDQKGYTIVKTDDSGTLVQVDGFNKIPE